MRLDALVIVPVVTALVAGCAVPAPTRPTVDPASTPEQIVRSLSNRKLTSRGTSNDGFGLATFKPYLLPLEVRCQGDGGQIMAQAPTEVAFDFRDANSIQHRTRVSMPQRLVCRSSSKVLWGASIRYNDTTFFPSAWAGEVFYYATIPLTFEPGEATGALGPSGLTDAATRRREADDCKPMREQYTSKLRSAPSVGMKVQFGVIVEVRLPLVLVQYDELGRQLKGREQAWVEASTLGPGTNCPQ